MRDVFYTILIVWVVWRIVNSISSYKSRQTDTNNRFSSSDNKHKEGETSVDYIPPAKKKIKDDEGEYVDYEEV